MDMGQGFIGTTKELNVDRGTLPSTLAWSCACSWLPAIGGRGGGTLARDTDPSHSLSVSLCLSLERDREREIERDS
jgi:hypothetical protein